MKNFAVGIVLGFAIVGAGVMIDWLIWFNPGQWQDIFR